MRTVAASIPGNDLAIARCSAWRRRRPVIVASSNDAMERAPPKTVLPCSVRLLLLLSPGALPFASAASLTPAPPLLSLDCSLLIFSCD